MKATSIIATAIFIFCYYFSFSQQSFDNRDPKQRLHVEKDTIEKLNSAPQKANSDTTGNYERYQQRVKNSNEYMKHIEERKAYQNKKANVTDKPKKEEKK